MAYNALIKFDIKLSLFVYFYTTYSYPQRMWLNSKHDKIWSVSYWSIQYKYFQFLKDDKKVCFLYLNIFLSYTALYKSTAW